jgi:hypothetical protein
MAEKDLRAKLSSEQFDAIPFDPEDPIDGYHTELIESNEKFRGIYQEFPRGYEDPALIKQLTRGQQLLILLGILDGQIRNGGITQFFWNYPDYLFEVADAIEELGHPELLANYERALESLVGNKDRWFELRREWYNHPNDLPWESFQESYRLLNLSWFDKDYFDKRGYNEKGEWVKQKSGLHESFIRKLADYVRAHRDEFIEEGGGHEP